MSRLTAQTTIGLRLKAVTYLGILAGVEILSAVISSSSALALAAESTHSAVVSVHSVIAQHADTVTFTAQSTSLTAASLLSAQAQSGSELSLVASNTHNFSAETEGPPEASAASGSIISLSADSSHSAAAQLLTATAQHVDLIGLAADNSHAAVAEAQPTNTADASHTDTVNLTASNETQANAVLRLAAATSGDSTSLTTVNASSASGNRMQATVISDSVLNLSVVDIHSGEAEPIIGISNLVSVLDLSVTGVSTTRSTLLTAQADSGSTVNLTASSGHSASAEEAPFNADSASGSTLNLLTVDVSSVTGSLSLATAESGDTVSFSATNSHSAEAGEIINDLPVTAGLVGQWDAAQGVTTIGSDVINWGDQATGNDLDVVVGTPQLVPAGVNGKPYISFDGAYLRRASFSGLPTGNSARSMFAALRYRSSAFGGVAYGSANTNQACGLVVDSSGELRFQLWGTDVRSNETGTGVGWIIQHVDFNVGGSGALYVNDVKAENFLRENINTDPLGEIVFGAEIDLAPTVDMDVAEVLIYDRQLSGTERSAVVGYLQSKYGLS